MAKEEIAYTVSVETGNSAKSLSELKKEFKEAQNSLSGLLEGTKEYTEALKKLGAAKDEMNSLNKTIKAFSGTGGQIKSVGEVVSSVASGFSAATGAMSLMGKGTKDLQKTLVKLQSVMAFQQGIQGLEGIKGAFKDLWKVIRANPIGAIIAGLAALAVIAVQVYEAMDKSSASTKELTKQLEIQKKVNESLSKSISREIELLTAQGASQEKIIQKKRELVNAQIAELETSIRLHQSKLRDIQDNDGVWEGMLRIQEATLRKLGLDKEADAVANAIQAEKQSRMKEDIEAIKKEKEDLLDLQNTIKVLSAQEIKIQEEKTKKYLEEQAKRDKSAREGLDKLREYNKQILTAIENDEKAAREKREAAIDEALAKEISDSIASQEARMELFRINSEQSLALQLEYLEYEKAQKIQAAEGNASAIALIEEQYDNKIREKKEANINAQIDSYQQLGQATMDIANLVFAHQLKQAEGNASKQRQIAQRQFKVNKALGIVNATIDGIQAVQKALNNPYPLNIILAAASGIAAAANIAKISSTKFDGGGASGGGGGVGDVPSAPNIAPPTQGGTQLNADGTVKNNNTTTPTIKAVVVETDITKTQNKVSSIESNSRL